jgi:hypothetical protein
LQLDTKACPPHAFHELVSYGIPSLADLPFAHITNGLPFALKSAGETFIERPLGLPF